MANEINIEVSGTNTAGGAITTAQKQADQLGGSVKKVDRKSVV